MQILALRKYPAPSQEMDAINYLLDSTFSDAELKAVEDAEIACQEELKQLGETHMWKECVILICFCLSDVSKPVAKGKAWKVPLFLRQVFAQLQTMDQQTISTLRLTHAFGWNKSAVAVQHDVNELNK